MYRLDSSQFPVLVLSVEDSPLTIETMQQLEQSLLAAFDRKTPFTILALTTAETETKAPKEVTRYSNDMFRRMKPLFAQWCAGYAGVMRAGKLFKLYKPVAGKVVRNRIGCDGDFFEREDEARAWLDQKLRARAAKVT
jgi:hypothetical protein